MGGRETLLYLPLLPSLSFEPGTPFLMSHPRGQCQKGPASRGGPRTPPEGPSQALPAIPLLPPPPLRSHPFFLLRNTDSSPPCIITGHHVNPDPIHPPSAWPSAWPFSLPALQVTAPTSSALIVWRQGGLPATLLFVLVNKKELSGPSKISLFPPNSFRPQPTQNLPCYHGKCKPLLQLLISDSPASPHPAQD